MYLVEIKKLFNEDLDSLHIFLKKKIVYKNSELQYDLIRVFHQLKTEDEIKKAHKLMVKLDMKKQYEKKNFDNNLFFQSVFQSVFHWIKNTTTINGARECLEICRYFTNSNQTIVNLLESVKFDVKELNEIKKDILKGGDK